jgi:malonyl-CoA/methylmalonyl-CoA synthetase
MHHLRFPADWVDDADREYPQRVFLRTDTGRELNYASLRDESGRFASALMRRGVRAGERVAAHVDKSAEAVLLYVACLRMGAVFLPINVANTLAEVDYVLLPRNAVGKVQKKAPCAAFRSLYRPN